MSGALEFFFNLSLTILLGLTVWYCWTLNRRIRVLQDGRGELASLLKHFDDSTTRASESILALQTASKKIGETIQSRIDKANYTMDDLSFLIERANKLADTMEAGISVVRQREKLIERETRQPARQRIAEEELPPRHTASHAEPAKKIPPKAELPEEDAPSGAVAALQAMLDKLNTKKPPVLSEEKTTSAGAERPRSQAERELLELIRKGQKS